MKDKIWRCPLFILHPSSLFLCWNARGVWVVYSVPQNPRGGRREDGGNMILGATGFDRESENMGCGLCCSDTLNGAKNLIANTYQEPMALVA